MHDLFVPIILVLGLLGAVVIPRHLALKSAAIANVWLALGINGVGVPILYTLAAARRSGLSRPRSATGRFALASIIGLCAVSFFALAWSPARSSAASAGFEWAALAAAVAASISALQSRGLMALPDLMAWALWPGLVEALTTVIFRLRPDIEQRYYLSSFGHLILGATGKGLYDGTAPNNVTEAGRAGGIFFVNCNRATMAMGVLLLATLAARIILRRARFTVGAVALVFGIVMADSKTGLALLIALPACAFAAALVSAKREAGTKLTIVALVGVAGYFVASVILNHARTYVAASESTLVPRQQLWSQAIAAIRSSPVRGLGFGGWQARWESGGVPLKFTERPVHNWVLQSWLDAGALNAALSIAFVVLVLICCLQAMKTSLPTREACVFFLSAAAFIWVAVHGLGDNTTLVADPVCLVPYAMTLGIVLQPDLIRSVANGVLPGEHEESTAPAIPASVSET